MTVWYALYTQPHAEGRALQHLRMQGFQAYLPRHQRWIQHARKRTRVLRPLFPRYLFVALDEMAQRWAAIRSTIGIVGPVSSSSKPLPVPQDIIATLRQRETDGAFDVTAAAPQLRVDEPVRVTSGPFEDAVGRLLQAADHERVLILLELLGRSVHTDVPLSAVEAA